MDYLLTVLSLICLFIILSQSYNLVLGYTGMVHVGHIAFMAIGAYTSALLTQAGAPFLVGVGAAILAAGLAGFILGLPTVRFREDYLVAATLSMGEIVRLILLNERQWTGGSTGIPQIIKPEIFGVVLQSKTAIFLFILAMTILVLLIVRRLVSSPFGKVLEAIREDELAAASLGKNTTNRKLEILVIASMLAGFAGALYAHTVQFIDPNTFDLQKMIYVLLIVVFGGAGNFWGPIVGSIILYSIFELMRFLPFPDHYIGPLRWMLYSGLLITIIILKPKGIMGEKLIKKKL